MTPQELADELARLAGWMMLDIMQTGNATGPVWCGPNGQRARNHPYLIGSLDALEAFRRERLPGWEFWVIYGPCVESRGWGATIGCNFNKSGRNGTGPDEWTARASALVAAAREEKP